MQNDRYTAKGETFVMEEDTSRNGSYYPVDFRRKDDRPYRKPGGWRSYRSYYPPSRDTRFWGYRGYVPQWYQEMRQSKWDRLKLIGVTVIASYIFNAMLPTLLKGFLMP